MLEKAYIEVRVHSRFEHFWKRASTHRRYLKCRHPHNFEIRVEMQVFEFDREIEFHDLQDMLEKFLWSKKYTFVEASCETIAATILLQMKSWFGTAREYDIEVWEDADCGGKVKYTPGVGVEEVAKAIDEELKKSSEEVRECLSS